MPISISKLPEVTNVKDNSFMLITQDGTTKRTMCDQFVTEEEARLDEFSPTVITSKSMSKTGEGDDVDYSSSAYDAPMKDVVLKGKTMVNCIQEPSSQDVVLPYEFEEGQYVTINDTKESGALGVELKGQTLVNLFNTEDIVGSNGEMTIEKGIITLPIKNHRYNNFNIPKSKCTMFKPSTKYTMWVNMLENRSEDNEGETQQSGSFWLHTYDYSSSIVKTSNQGVYGCRFENNEVGVKTCVFETHAQNEYDSKSGGLNFDLPCYYAKNGGIQRVSIVIIEGDWSNQELPFDKFFTGMTSCKMPILCTVGKNLFDLTNAPNGYLTADNPYTLASSDHNNKTSAYIKVKPNTKYTYSFDGFTPSQVGNTYWTGFYYYKRIGEVSTVHPSRITFSSSSEEHKQITFTTPSDCNYIRIGSRGLMLNGATAQLEEATSATSYEPYKTSILSLPEEVVLRSLPNGVCDTFNTRTSVYTQRVYETTITGTEGWVQYDVSNTNRQETIAFSANLGLREIFDNEETYSKLGGIVCDKLNHINSVWGTNKDIEGISADQRNVIVQIKKTRLTSEDVAGFKTWLTSNNLKVGIQLKVPTITKINLPSTLKSWNTTTHIHSEIPENSLYPILSHSNPTYPVILKPSTKYSIVANSYSNDHTNSTINFNLGGATASTTVGNRVTTITTLSTLTSEELVMSGRGNKLNNVMVIEGDVMGDEPYFEGICDVKSPILSNVGKNLWDIDKLSDAVCTNKTNNSFVLKSWASTVLTNQQIREILKPNTKYTMRAKFRLLKGSSLPSYSQTIQFLLYAPNETSTNVSFFLAGSTHTIGEEYEVTNTFTTPSDFTTKDLLGYSKRYANDSTWELGEVEFTDVQLEETSASTAYEPYKSNTTTFEQKDDKTIVLRSLPNGVCDTLNVETGEYVQRIGEKLLNGDESGWYAWVGVENDTYKAFALGKWVTDSKTNSSSVKGNELSDHFLEATSANQNGEWFMTHTDRSNDNMWIAFNVVKSKLVDTTVASFTSYLKQNPITVQYELETPVVSTIDVQGFPYAYTSGHVQLSSGSIEQSLTPKVEYNIATNRGGQITQNTKSLIRQGKLLNDIENKINQIIEATVNDGIMLMKLRNK